MANILVTGSNGQLGSELKVIKEKFPNNYTFIDIEDLNLTNQKEVNDYFNIHPVDFCINCAAYTAVDKAETDISGPRAVNIMAVDYLARACKLKGATLIHISTDFVFDGRSNAPYVETDPTNPVNEYGQTKLEGEERALELIKNILIIRTSWLYSSFGNNFVKTMLRLGKERDSVNVIFDQIGTPTYAADLANAILTIILQLDKGLKRIDEVSGIYHFSNEGVASWYDFAAEIFLLAQLSCTVSPVRTEAYPTPAKRPRYTLMDKEKIKTTFGITIDHWKTSLSRCIDLLG